MSPPTNCSTSATSSEDVSICSSDGVFQLATLGKMGTPYHDGQATPLPVGFWHAFTPRDVASSKKLRKISKKSVDGIMKIARKESRGDEKTDWTETLAAIDRAVPKLPSGLRYGILGIFKYAMNLEKELGTVLENRDPGKQDVASSNDEAAVESALEMLAIEDGDYDGDCPFFPHIHVALQFLRGEVPASTTLPRFGVNWFELLGGIHEEIWSCYWEQEPQDLEPLHVFLNACCGLGMFDFSGKFRSGVGVFTTKPPVSFDDDEDFSWRLYELEGQPFIMSKSEYDDDVSILQYAPDGDFVGLKDFKWREEQELERLWDGSQITFVSQSMQTLPRPALQPDKLAEVAQAADVSLGEAALVWLGAPFFNNWDRNFLPKEWRTQLGLKVAEADTARTAVRNMKRNQTLRPLLKAMLSNPGEIWADDGAATFTRLAEAWSATADQRLSVPTDFGKRLNQVFGWRLDVADLLNALADPQNHRFFDATAEWKLDADEYEIQVTAGEGIDDEQVFNGRVSWGVAITASMLYHALPAGNSARVAGAAGYEQTMKCLQSPKLILPIATAFLYSGKNPAARLENILKQLFSKTKKQGPALMADDGTCLGGVVDESICLAFRPARIKTAKALEKLKTMSQAIDFDDDAERDELIGFTTLKSASFKELVKRLKKTNVPEGGYEANPRLSAPQVVADVAVKNDLSENAAVAYLQTLTLFDCTSKNLKLWNDWSTSDYNKALKELESAELVLKAKRSRAGRNHFLPGGWETLKSPNLPLESWKCPLYNLTYDKDGKLQIPLAVVTPLEPYDLLFAKAWKRVLDGDEPKYEEV